MKTSLGKLLYGVTFCVALPLLLAAWAHLLEPKVATLPPLHSPWLGATVTAAGLALMLAAMLDLWRRGGGLPMNAFPPPRFVSKGVYRWLPHPIYVGFGLVVPGLALTVGVRAGLWCATPVVWLAAAALVIGYERIDLQRRFGRPAERPFLSRPPASADSATASSRLASALIAFGPWLLAYQACVLLGPSPHAFDTMLPFERGWPVLAWGGAFYLGAYAWTALAPLAAATQRDLRQFTGTALVGTALITWCFLSLPFIAAPRELLTHSTLANLLALDRSLDTAACAFPSFHVFWAFTAAELWAARLSRPFARLVALFIALSCLTTGVHSFLDVLAGWLVWLLAAHRGLLWSQLLRLTERVANSWRDWRVGRVRVINHGGYVALATALGLWLVSTALGPAHTPAVITVALCAIAGAGLWGQWLEASSQLSRPFGYFGGLFGGTLGCALSQLLWRDGWHVLAGFALAAPVIQGVGRLRCLVQGCCHGRAAEAALGIRHAQPLSRVCKLAKLGGVPIHPTPLYSIVGNLLIFGLLARLWFEGSDLAFIAGAYLILSTCARFMEEGYRGEPQTRHFAGLPIYQWLALACLVAGLACTVLPAPARPAWPGLSPVPLTFAIPLGLLVWFCMGVDFPSSPRRMSRLA